MFIKGTLGGSSAANSRQAFTIVSGKQGISSMSQVTPMDAFPHIVLVEGSKNCVGKMSVQFSQLRRGHCWSLSFVGHIGSLSACHLTRFSQYISHFPSLEHVAFILGIGLAAFVKLSNIIHPFCTRTRSCACAWF